MILEETIKKLDKLQIDKEYLSGKSYGKLEKEYHISDETIRLYLLVKHIPIRKRKGGNGFNPNPPIVGTKYGLWTVIAPYIKKGREIKDNPNDRSIYWLVLCACGQLSWKSRDDLINGRTTRCKKCGNKLLLKLNNEIGAINTILLHKYKQTKNGISTRKHRGRRKPLTFEITLERLLELYELLNHKCVLSGLSIEPDITLPLNKQYLSIDRIDSFEGYTNENIQLVDKRINMMKGSLSNEEFIKLCTYVTDFNRNKTDT